MTRTGLADIFTRMGAGEYPVPHELKQLPYVQMHAIAKCLQSQETIMAFEKPNLNQLAHRFVHHAPKGDQASRYEAIRAEILKCAAFCVERTPCSPEQTRALNALDEAMFLFNAAIARGE